MAVSEIIGREEELARIAAFLGNVERGPAALVLTGEAGIGKTILWETGLEEARARLGRVLLCRGVAAEATLSFAGLSDLLGNVLEEVGPSLVPPRRRALEVALLLAEPGDQPPDAHAIGLAVLDVFRALAQSGPVLVALDDVQWLDPASAGAIQIALRRLREEPVGLLATLRTAPELEDPFELERSVLEGRLDRVAVGPLSLGALHQLLAERLGLELTRPELTRVREETVGNPFFALELGRELVRTNVRPTPGQALHVPDSLRELLGDRLARLPAETVEVLLLAAALARPTIELVGQAHGDRERVLAALETAVGEAVVELQDSSVRFTHPLLGSICYEQAPIWIRRAVHRTLAGAVTDREERARHLALAAEGPDAFVASELDSGAEQAAARGAPAAAAELCELAAELTPDDPARSRERRLRAATFHRLAGERDRMVSLLEPLLEEVPSGVERADILFALASMFQGADVRRAVQLCDEALAEATEDDARCVRILSFRAWSRALAGASHAALADARAALGKAEQVGDPALLAVAIARAGQTEQYAAEITPGLLERGVEIEERLGTALEFSESPRFSLARLLLRLGEVDRALLEELRVTWAERGDEVSRMNDLWYLSLTDWVAGRLQVAYEHAAAAHELGEQIRYPHLGSWVGRVRALIEVDLGLVEEARISAEEGLASSRASSLEHFAVAALGALGRLELALGNLEAAAAYLSELPPRLLAGGFNDPAAPIWADTIETLAALGEVEQAHAYLEPYEASARRLGGRLAMEGVQRSRGLVAAAEGDLGAALETLEALRGHQPEPPWQLERARTLLCLGMVRRQARQKKAAREALEQALAIFEELGARLWAEKAQAELRRISGRRAASEELTVSERRVAELAAGGRTNKEIAAELFMGVSTVEAHLSHVYRKLGVRRAELGERLATPVEETADV